MLKEKETLEKNKKKVDEFLTEKKISFVEPVSMEGGMEFLEYLIGEGISDDLADVKYVREREPLGNPEVFPIIYMIALLTEVGSTRRTQEVLKNEAMMKMLGFSEEQIKNGITKRGKKNQYGGGFARKSGVMASTTVVDNLACFDYPELVNCFNLYIKRVSLRGEIDFGHIYILDSTIVETEPGYPGAMPIKVKDDEGNETGRTVWGFKVFILTSAKTLVPVAVHITSANDADSPMLIEMVKKGVDNLGEGRIKTVLADRGFIDGKQLYQLKHEMGIDFVIPVRKNMDIWKCMVGLRDDNKNNIEEWEYGKKGLSGGYLSKGSVSYSQYSDVDAGNKKYKNGSPLNAVVVTRWDGEEISAGNEKVIVTSGEVGSAVELIELYGQRSLIENCNFRELKQAASLGSLPQQKNTEIAKDTAYAHMLLCVFALAIFNILVETAHSNTPEVIGKLPKNIREFNFIKKCEKPKMFVLCKHYYYIYEMKEFMGFCGFEYV